MDEKLIDFLAKFLNEWEDGNWKSGGIRSLAFYIDQRCDHEIWWTSEEMLKEILLEAKAE